MTRKAADGSKRVQVRLSGKLAKQVEALSDDWGIPESAVGAMLIAAGLTRFRDAFEGFQADEKLPRVVAELVRDARDEDERTTPDDRPGFRPGGKPRSGLELAVSSSARGDEWQGYMRGL